VLRRAVSFLAALFLLLSRPFSVDRSLWTAGGRSCRLVTFRTWFLKRLKRGREVAYMMGILLGRFWANGHAHMTWTRPEVDP
jgi:hypothetical protein